MTSVACNINFTLLIRFLYCPVIFMRFRSNTIYFNERDNSTRFLVIFWHGWLGVGQDKSQPWFKIVCQAPLVLN
jgi:hypothetical protein